MPWRSFSQARRRQGNSAEGDGAAPDGQQADHHGPLDRSEHAHAVHHAEHGGPGADAAMVGATLQYEDVFAAAGEPAGHGRPARSAAYDDSARAELLDAR